MPEAGAEGAEGPPLLDPAVIRLRRAASGAVQLIGSDLCHLQVTVFRAFPLSAPEEWIAFFHGGGGFIGMLPDLHGLDEASQAICREELELRYVVPRAVDIVTVREEVAENRWNPALVWDVVTERGPLRLHLPNLQDHVRVVGGGRLLLTDRDGRRCLLDPQNLSSRGRVLLQRYLWLDPA